jgi:hypothetical protein
MRFFTWLLVAALSFSASAQITNWKGYLDTTIMWVAGTATMKYSKVYPLTDAENLSLVTMANDTSEVRLGGDSTRIVYGCQIGNIVVNGSGNIDTAWAVLDTIDTLCASGFQSTEGGGRITSAGSISETWGKADTLSVTGYAIQTRPIQPYWGTLIRFWYQGITGNSAVSSVKVVAALLRRIGQVTVQK